MTKMLLSEQKRQLLKRLFLPVWAHLKSILMGALIIVLTVGILFCWRLSRLNTSMVFVKGGAVSIYKSRDNNGSKYLSYYGEKVSSFYMARYEVTQAEWEEVMGYNPSFFKGKDLPVENVSWEECLVFCNLLSVKNNLSPCYYKWKYDPIEFDRTKNGFRLPTEAEWQYAAQDGEKSKKYFYSGSNDLNEVAWYQGNDDQRTKPVGMKKPNELGIYDMTANVSEWCWDKYPVNKSVKSAYYQRLIMKEFRIIRGGNWTSTAKDCLVTKRSYHYQNARHNLTGFRLCRSLGVRG